MVHGETHGDLKHEPEACDLILVKREEEVIDLRLFRCHLRVSSSRGVAPTARVSATDKISSAIGASLYGMSALGMFIGVDTTIVHSGMPAVVAISAGAASALTFVLLAIFLVSFRAARGESESSESSSNIAQGARDEHECPEQWKDCRRT